MPPNEPLPTGTVTFLFTDIEGSTHLTAELGAAGYGVLLERHRQALRAAFERYGGIEVGTEGDSFFVVFTAPTSALAAAADGQLALARTEWPVEAPIRVRMGIHSGDGLLVDGSYVGPDVNRAARIAAAGHGGQVLVSETTAALVADPPAGVHLRSLGRHRLKDLRPEHLAQLDVDGLPDDFPPIRSLDARPNNLPTQLTSFVGREHEVAEVVRLIETARLVTLTGPGGTGKTRLSLQVAAETAGDQADGATFVALAAVSDPDLVTSAIATTLGLPDAGGRPLRDRLVDYLRGLQHLLVLDNFEQVAAAAPLLSDLLREAPRLRIIVSSRVPLRISGEQEYPVPPLELPATDGDAGAGRADAIGGNEAVRLFVDRARSVRPDFALDDSNAGAVAEIVSHLDGLPLAIELAAARSRLLSPGAMLPRLEHRLDLLAGGMRDLPKRQQTLRGAIAWSHDLLEPPEQRLFARFSVFVGGAELSEAESVCGPAAEVGQDVLDGLEKLVDHSLLRQVERVGEPRFFMLETIRDFAVEQLAASGEQDALRRRHALAYLGLAERAAPSLTTSDQRTWLDRLARDHDNLRAVHGWAVETGDAGVGLRLITALWRFWQIRGHLFEGRSRADAAIAISGARDAGEAYAAALEAAGGLCYWLADFPCAQSRYEAVLAVRRAGGDPRAIAEALYNLGFTELFFRADIDRARQLGEEALALFRDAGDDRGIARALWALANVASYQEDPAAARRYCEEAIPILRRFDEAFMLGWSLYTLGQVETLEGNLDASRERLLEALDLFAAADDMSGFAIVLDGLAINAQRAGDHQRAARLSGVVANLEAKTGTGLNPHNRLFFGFDPTALRDDPDTAAAWAEGEGLSTADAVAYARTAVGGPIDVGPSGRT
jgi:predicted ATPase/class 3 adenylate cyclase